MKFGVIVDVEATAAHRTEETEATKTMIERVEKRHDLKPQRLIGDTAYGTGPMLEWMVEDKDIEPHVPVWEKFRRTDGTFLASDFKWDEQANEYRCPRGEPLRSDWRAFRNPRTHITHADTIVYLRPNWPVVPVPSSHAAVRTLQHDTSHGAVREVTQRGPQGSHDCRLQAVAQRSEKVEVLFAHLKRILKLDRLRLRGRRGARDEVLLVATAQNLRRMAKRWMQMTMQIEPIGAT